MKYFVTLLETLRALAALVVLAFVREAPILFLLLGIQGHILRVINEANFSFATRLSFYFFFLNLNLLKLYFAFFF